MARTLKKRPLTPFGVEVKNKLNSMGKTEVEMCKTLNIVPSYLSAILHGSRAGKKHIDNIERYINGEPINLTIE